MADSNIGSLPQAQNLDDDSLLVAEQQGTAVKVTGAQFKEFGRQAVIGQVQGYVDQAEAAADRAVSAVSAVTEMTVEASTLASGQNATVTKTTKDGKVNLAFGLPRGEQGIPGPEGQTGPRGPQGPTGKGLTILGYYDTLDELKAAVPSPDVGDAYGVGLIAPYNIYVFDSVTNDWKDNGQLSGGGGGVLPEDVVTSEGGASLEYGETIPAGEHTILFTEEEDAQLEAADIAYDTSTSGMTADNVQGAIDELFTSVSDGKSLIASAITDKGVATAEDATFQQMADNIGQISDGGDTSDATATSFDILAPKTAYTAAGKVEGVIPTLLGRTYTPGLTDQTIADGLYLGGVQVIKGDQNLTSGNIKSGVTLFGVEGSLESTFKATLTVTADTGAVVTATHSGGTEVSGLSQTGTVVLDLPLEGVWSVTAVRGAAQYNTVTITVTSSYNASLTAEVHIEYFMNATGLSNARSNMGATSVGNYALFAGGYSESGSRMSDVDAYDTALTRTTATALSRAKAGISSAKNGNFALFGGDGYSELDVYNSALTRTNPVSLMAARSNLAAATIGGYSIFAGGSTDSYVASALADAFTGSMTSTTAATKLSVARYGLAAASSSNYAIFAGGYSSSFLGTVDAYDKSLTKSTPTQLSEARSNLSAASAGNYCLFAGGQPSSSGSSVVDAYDLFLTRTTPAQLSVARYEAAATTIGGHAIFSGGKRNGSSTSYAIVDTVDVYDPYLVHTTPTALSVARYALSAASLENYAIFGGGIYYRSTGSGFENFHKTSVVDVYRYV